jgi:cell division protein FtsB
MQEEEQGVESFEQDEPEMTEPEAQQPPEQAEAQPSEPATEQEQKPRRLRRILIWSVGLLLLFALGVAAAWFLQIGPVRETNRVLRTELDTAQQSVEALSADVDRLQPLEAENESLREQVDRLESHIFLLDVLVDVSKAQLALVEEDPIAAKDALQDTGQRLEQLEQRLSGSDAEAVAGMSERLKLAIEEVETDEFAARRDLEILANNLIALEQGLFEE